MSRPSSDSIIFRTAGQTTFEEKPESYMPASQCKQQKSTDKAKGMTTARWSMPSTWSRQTMLLVSSTVTIVVFLLDSALQQDATASFVAGLGSEFVFYAVGLATAFCYLKLSPSFKKSGKNKKAKRVDSIEPTPKQATGRSPVAHADAANGFGRLSPKAALPAAELGGAHGGGMCSLYGAVKRHLSEGAVAAAEQQLLATRGEADTSCYNLMIQYHARHDQAAALKWLERLTEAGLRPNEQSFLALIIAQQRQRNVRGMEQLLRKMLSLSIAASTVTYTMVIEAHIQQGNVRQASGWLRHMKQDGLAPEPSLYNTLIHACGSRGLLTEAREVFADMKQHGLKASVVTFTALIDASAKALDLRSAEEWMRAMLDMNIEPNVVSYSTMISACAKVGDLSRAEYWFDFMQERGVEPNAYSLSALINACAKVGDVEAACSWLKRAKQVGTAFDVVVGDAERAMAVFQQMREDGIASNIVIYSALAKPYAYRGAYAEVERIAELMESEGIAMNDYFLYSLLLAYSRVKPRESARAEAAFVRAMKQGIPMNDRIKKVLGSAVGFARSEQLCRQFA
eukprot:TRINITY_DN3883_c0_g1_i2.p1 TRINITY_DN3883_c0_g1~~TRINITY_DN3883_c0_g1_i2.p1  ORF type:complete len:569 (+),score=166.07 TRINITY_DN3883_c0_g1_i2:136-1842(+)